VAGRKASLSYVNCNDRPPFNQPFGDTVDWDLIRRVQSVFRSLTRPGGLDQRSDEERFTWHGGTAKRKESGVRGRATAGTVLHQDCLRDLDKRKKKKNAARMADCIST